MQYCRVVAGACAARSINVGATVYGDATLDIFDNNRRKQAVELAC